MSAASWTGERKTMVEKHVMISIPVLLVGGTEFQTLSLVRVLSGGGYRVTVCCYYEYDDAIVAGFRAAGAEVLLMKCRRADGLLRLIRSLVRLFRNLKPDIVHVQYLAPGFVPIIAARLAGVGTVFATVHQPGFAHGWKERSILLTAARICSAFFCVSKSVEESWFRSGNHAQGDGTGSRFAIYNAVDVREIGRLQSESTGEDIRRRLNLDGKKVVGVVGRLRREKGQKTLLRAMKSVLDVLPSAVLVVVGDGPDREDLEKEAAASGIGESIRWLGQRDQSEVYRLYGVMDVVAVPSLFEGFGLVAAEAMAAGAPVVASHVGGLPEVVRHGVTGLLVAPGDDRALALCLLLLLRDEKKAKIMGEEGRNRARMLFSPERFGSAVLSVYESPCGDCAVRLSQDRAL